VIKRILRIANSFEEAARFDREDVAALSFEQRISAVELLRRERFGAPQPRARPPDTATMFHFQSLDVYKRAVEFLPMAYSFAKLTDGEMASQLRRAALSINLNIAEGTGRFGKDERKFFVTARGSAFECAAILDAMMAIGIGDPRIDQGHELLARIVAMLTKLIGRSGS
jgi:four helix bundle protein